MTNQSPFLSLLPGFLLCFVGVWLFSSGYSSREISLLEPTLTMKLLWKPFDSIQFIIFSNIVFVSLFITDYYFFKNYRQLGEVTLRLFSIIFILFFFIFSTRIFYLLISSSIILKDIPWLAFFIKFLIFFIPDIFFSVFLLILLEKILHKLWQVLLVSIVYYVATIVLAQFHWDLGLLLFGHLPYINAPYEYFAGFNNYLVIHLFYVLYWLAITATVIGIFLLAKNILKNLRTSIIVLTFCSISIAIAAASYIHFKTVYSAYNIPYRYSFSSNKFRYKYTQTYDGLTSQRYPKIQLDEIIAKIEIFPDSENLILTGTYTLSNMSNKPVTNLLVTLPPYTKHIESSFNLASSEKIMPSLLEDINLINYQFTQPLQPNDKAQYFFKLSYKNLKGIFSPTYNNKITSYYSYIQNKDIFPIIGGEPNYFYIPKPPIKENEQIVKLDFDPANSFFQKKVRHIKLELVTESKQTAVTSGKLTKQWQDGSRTHYLYENHRTQRNYFPIVSAPYVKTRVQLENLDVVSYHLPQFQDNATFITGSTVSILQHYKNQLGFLPQHQISILQRPIDNGLSRTFPGLITLSTESAFDVYLDKADNKLAVFQLLAHELAHLWFGHYLITDLNKGSNSLSEGLSQFMSLNALKALKSKKEFERFYLYEVDIFNKYRHQDKPLKETENIDTERFLTYFKSSMLYFGLAERLSEEIFFDILKAYLSSTEVSHDQNLMDFSAFLKYQTKDHHTSVINEVFNHAGYYDFDVGKATFKSESDKYNLIIHLTVSRTERSHISPSTDSKKKEIMLAILDEKLEATVVKIPMKIGQQVIRITLNNKPNSIVIDPDYWYLDTNRSNNKAEFICLD